MKVILLIIINDDFRQHGHWILKNVRLKQIWFLNRLPFDIYRHFNYLGGVRQAKCIDDFVLLIGAMIILQMCTDESIHYFTFFIASFEI